MQIPIISSSILICLVLLIRYCFRNKVRAVWIYGLWGLVALRLLVPVQFFSFPAGSVKLFGGEDDFSVYNSEVLEPEKTLVYDADIGEEVFITEEIGKNEEPGIYSENVKEEEKKQISDTQTQITDGKIRGRNMMFLVWLLVAGGMFVFFLAMNFHMSHKLRRERKILENKARPRVYFSGCVSVPCLYGFFRPAVYLTRAVAEQSEEDRSYIILHEGMHYKHLDHIWAGARLLLICLYWFHPLVWIAAKLSRQDAEYAADEAVTENMNQEERLRYGKMILFTIGHGKADRTELSLASTASNSRRELERRLEKIAGKKKRSFVSVVILMVTALAVTACSFAGKQAETTVTPSDKGEALDKAVTEAIKQDFSGEMTTSSSWQYHGVKYGNIVEAHTTIAKTEKENEVTVYLANMVGAYGIGAPENKPEECYELRGGERRFAALTFEKEDGKYVLKEYWRPKGGGKFKNDLQKKFPASVSEEELAEYRYYHYLTAECHRQALEFLKASETRGQPSDKVEISKIKASDVEFVEVSTGKAQMVRIFSEKASGFVKKLVSAYNKMKLVPVTNIKENALDVKQSITLNFYTRDSSHPEQVIFDGKKICWIHGEPKAWVMDEPYFDYNEIMEKAESQQRHERIEHTGSRKVQDPYGGL